METHLDNNNQTVPRDAYMITTATYTYAAISF